MSHLIPTPRTDKNGVTSIRHMQPVVEKKPLRSVIPVVSAPVGDARTETERLAALLYPDETDPQHDSLLLDIEVIRKEIPGFLDGAERIFSGASETALSLFRERVTDVVARYKIMGSDYRWRTEWKRTLDHFREDVSPNDLRRLLHCGNVLEETGNTDRLNIPGMVSNVVLKEMHHYDIHFDANNVSDQQWRGIVAFTLTDLTHVSMPGLDPKQDRLKERAFNRETKKFIAYAGTHKDLNLLVRTATERKTLNVGELKQIIAAGKAAPSLSEGVL